MTEIRLGYAGAAKEGGDLHACRDGPGTVGLSRVQAEYQISRCKSGFVIVGPSRPIPTTAGLCQVAWGPSISICES